jgi:hypothetical protein
MVFFNEVQGQIFSVFMQFHISSVISFAWTVIKRQGQRGV